MKGTCARGRGPRRDICYSTGTNSSLVQFLNVLRYTKWVTPMTLRARIGLSELW